CPLCAGAITVAFRGRITVEYACPDPMSSGLRVLTDTDIGRRRQWQGRQLRGPVAVFAELLLAGPFVQARPASLPPGPHPEAPSVEAAPTSLTAVRYRESLWRPLIETAGAVLARGRDRGEAVEQVVATIWTAIEGAQVDERN